MRIGMTYDLRSEYLAEGYGLEETAEFDRPDTIDAIAAALGALGHEVDRIGHVRQLVARLADGSRWDLVFNIAEGLSGVGRESQIPALLDAYAIPYTFSDPVVNGLCMHKGFAKCVFRDAGLATADFRVVETAADIDTVNLGYPLFAKPNAEGTGKGIDSRSIINSQAELRDVCTRLLSRFNQPVLVETFMPGREFTVGVLGTGRDASAIGVMEVVLLENAEAGVYSYDNKELSEERVTYHLADDGPAREAAQLALGAWRAVGGRDAGRVDLRCGADGRPRLLEINTLAGLHPEHSDLPIMCGLAGLPYARLIGTIVASATARCGRIPSLPRVA